MAGEERFGGELGCYVHCRAVDSGEILCNISVVAASYCWLRARSMPARTDMWLPECTSGGILRP